MFNFPTDPNPRNGFLGVTDSCKQIVFNFARSKISIPNSIHSYSPDTFKDIFGTIRTILDKAHKLTEEWYSFENLSVVNKHFYNLTKLSRERIGAEIVTLMEEIEQIPRVEDHSSYIKHSYIIKCIDHGFFLNTLKIYFLRKPTALKKPTIPESNPDADVGTILHRVCAPNVCGSDSPTLISLLLHLNSFHKLSLLDEVDSLGRRPLHRICRSGIDGNIFPKLLSQMLKSDPNAAVNVKALDTSKDPHSAIHELTNRREDTAENCFKLLQNYGADLNEKNTLGNTPLHVSVEKVNPEAVKYLLDAGADANRRNNQNKTSFELAFDNAKNYLERINKYDTPNPRMLFKFIEPLRLLVGKVGVSFAYLKYMDPTCAVGGVEQHIHYQIHSIFKENCTEVNWILTDENGNTYLHQVFREFLSKINEPSNRDEYNYYENCFVKFREWMLREHSEMFKQQFTMGNKDGYLPHEIFDDKGNNVLHALATSKYRENGQRIRDYCAWIHKHFPNELINQLAARNKEDKLALNLVCKQSPGYDGLFLSYTKKKEPKIEVVASSAPIEPRIIPEIESNVQTAPSPNFVSRIFSAGYSFFSSLWTGFTYILLFKWWPLK